MSDTATANVHLHNNNNVDNNRNVCARLQTARANLIATAKAEHDRACALERKLEAHEAIVSAVRMLLAVADDADDEVARAALKQSLSAATTEAAAPKPELVRVPGAAPEWTRGKSAMGRAALQTLMAATPMHMEQPLAMPPTPRMQIKCDDVEAGADRHVTFANPAFDTCAYSSDGDTVTEDDSSCSSGSSSSSSSSSELPRTRRSLRLEHPRVTELKAEAQGRISFRKSRQMRARLTRFRASQNTVCKEQ